MGTYEAILYEKQRKGVLITLNQPEAMNSISPEMRRDLDAGLEEAKADPEVRAVVLTGAGRAFCAGAWMRSGRAFNPVVWPSGLAEGSTVADLYQGRNAGSQGNSHLYMFEYPKPIIGAINGWALGAGSWLALWTHITIASENAVFGQPEVRHGNTTNFIWTQLAGFKHALRYGLTGDHIDAEEALRIGIVNKVVPRDQLLEECFGIVERIAHIPPETITANLHITTIGVEMTGLNQALLLGSQMPPLGAMRREEFNRHLNEAQDRGGMREFMQVRDAPFQPEPFGPRSKKVMEAREAEGKQDTA
jgi:enoyl-CoA hydratase/carnithine racemase